MISASYYQGKQESPLIELSIYLLIKK